MDDRSIDPEIVKFFGPLTEAIFRFANLHNVRVEDYVELGPFWRLLFRHPQGGIGMIAISRNSPSAASVSAAWWHDDFKTYKRYSVRPFNQTIEATAGPLEAALEHSLKYLLSKRFGDWDDESESFEEYWKPMKFLIESYESQFPELRI